MGSKLWSSAEEHHVLCVTHLSPIASFGSQYSRVAYEVVGGRTVSSARQLSSEEHVEEIAVVFGVRLPRRRGVVRRSCCGGRECECSGPKARKVSLSLDFRRSDTASGQRSFDAERHGLWGCLRIP